MNKKTVSIIIGVVLIIGSFYGGMLYGKSQNSGLKGEMGDFPTGGMTGVRSGNAGGSMISGEIISKDATSITIKLQNGGSQIVLVSESTPVTKSTSGAASDLAVGTQVMVSGTTNTDKSITAKSVQIRPANETNPAGTPPEAQ